jgi:hypothetical protein
VAQELLVNGRPIEYDRVPVRYMRDGMKLYFENGAFEMAADGGAVDFH